MNRLHVFLFMILVLLLVSIQGFEKHKLHATKLPQNGYDESGSGGCPFAKIHNRKAQGDNGNLYQKPLKLEKMTKTLNRLVQRDTRHKNRVRQFYTRRFPYRSRYINSRQNGISTYFPNRGRYYFPRKPTYYPVKPSFASVPTTKNGNSPDRKNDENPLKASRGKPNIENEDILCHLEKTEALITCDPNHAFRSFSGRCNNLDTNMNFGKHSSIFKRLLPSEYDDGISHPRRKNVEGGILPNPRRISSTVHQDSSSLDQRYTLALMQWGQFLDHDITLTPFIDPLAKCEETCDRKIIDNLDQTTVIGPCYSIPVPEGDSYFPNTDDKGQPGKCLPLIRSLPAQKNLGPRDQMNAITAYIDASNLYGSDPCMNQQLRLYKGGKLKDLKHPMSPKIFKPLMPRHAHHPECKSPTGKCFMTGDDRNSEQPGLVSMHTMMMREHNRIAEQISLENVDWNDEKVFHETRKIIIAVNQHITYNEFLPRVLGPDLMNHFELELQSPDIADMHYNGYDGSCSADIFNEFATAAFRFGHSLIRPGFDLVSEPNSTTPLTKHIELKNHFFQPDMTFGVHVVDKLLRGMVNSPMASFDRAITSEVTDHLFEKQGIKYSGQDLAALNIQRGRDHGIPGYSKYYKMCSKIFPHNINITELKTFNDLRHVMDSEAIQALSSVYPSVEDIDLFPGGLSETPLPGAVVGPTFGCIIGLQFKKLRKCDRFWYETPDATIGFTADQLREIKKITLSSIMCRSWDVNSAIQKRAFDMEHPTDNPLLSCTEENHPTIKMSRFWNKFRPLGRSELPTPTSCDIGGRIVTLGEEIRTSACTICSCSLQGNTQCYSDVVMSCEVLTKEFGRSAVAADMSCQAQCPEIIKHADTILATDPVVPL